MALNIKNTEVERLAEELARLTGETKTQAIKRALEDRKKALAYKVVNKDRKARLTRFLEANVWPLVPPKLLGRKLPRKQREQLLGFGPEGV